MCYYGSKKEDIETNDFIFMNEFYKLKDSLSMWRYINSGEALIALKEALKLLSE